MLGLYELLGHFSNLMYTLGYAIKDIVRLRIFLLVGCAAETVYGLKAAERPLWAIVFWSVLGFCVNGAQIVALYRERRRRPQFTAEEQDLFKTIFRQFTHEEFRSLINTGGWKDFGPTETLTIEGGDVPHLILLVRGMASVEVAGQRVATLEKGRFIGEMSFLTGGVASATVRTETPARCLVWSKHVLREALLHDAGLQTAMQSAFNADLVAKLVLSSKGAH